MHPTVAAVLFIAWFVWNLPGQRQFDSEELYRGCRNILDWWQSRILTIDNPRPFPLFQYVSGVPAVWAVRRYFSFDIFSFWCTCSLLSWAGMVVIFQRVARQISQPAVGWAMLLVMASGPALMYANCTFNELVSAFFILSFTAAVTGIASPALCVALFWLSGITKETAPVVLTMIWIGSLWMRWPQMSRKLLDFHVKAAIAAIAITVGTNAAFNQLRFGTLWNKEYLQPQGLVHWWAWRMQYCVALWISPNGGILVFWPTLVIPMIAVMIIALRSHADARPAVIVAIVLAGLTVGFSGWWQPFGWYSWGPRLMIPWLPACLLILIRGYPDAWAQLVRALVGRTQAFILTAAAVCLFAFPHAMAALEPSAVERFFAPDWRFPHGAHPQIQSEEYALNVYLAWQKLPPMLIEPFRKKLTLLHVVKCIGFVAALVALLYQCRQPAEPTREDTDGLFRHAIAR